MSSLSAVYPAASDFVFDASAVGVTLFSYLVYYIWYTKRAFSTSKGSITQLGRNFENTLLWVDKFFVKIDAASQVLVIQTIRNTVLISIFIGGLAFQYAVLTINSINTEVDTLRYLVRCIIFSGLLFLSFLNWALVIRYASHIGFIIGSYEHHTAKAAADAAAAAAAAAAIAATAAAVRAGEGEGPAQGRGMNENKSDIVPTVAADSSSSLPLAAQQPSSSPPRSSPYAAVALHESAAAVPSSGSTSHATSHDLPCVKDTKRMLRMMNIHFAWYEREKEYIRRNIFLFPLMFYIKTSLRLII